jgi:hypothetical protein
VETLTGVEQFAFEHRRTSFTYIGGHKIHTLSHEEINLPLLTDEASARENCSSDSTTFYNPLDSRSSRLV